MKPNVLVLTIDSLRADKIYGNNKTSLTPNIDKLISKGVYFSQAISTSDTTGLSLGSLYTAQYPFKTGITHFSYNPEVLTCFKILKNSGYNTYATVPDARFFLKILLGLTERETYVYDKRESWLQLVGGIGNQIVSKLERLQPPWIYYIHLMDLHSPFFIPKEYDSDKYGKTRYDRMISSIDFWIGKFLEKIDLSNTLVVLSADHGDHIPVVPNWGNAPQAHTLLKKGKKMFPALEPLGLKLFVLYHSLKKKHKINKLKNDLTEKQLLGLIGRGQKHLFDELIRIPLIFSGYGTTQKIVSDQVKQVDIFPTILDILAVDSMSPNVDGRSLVPLFTSDSLEETPAYIETGARNEKNAKNPTIHGKIIGVRTSKYKYWRSRDDSSQDVALFDLVNDPREENNIANDNPSLVNTMERILSDIKKDSNKLDKNKVVTEEQKTIEEELKKLGYL